MLRAQRQLHRTCRATAWLLLLVCAWMGTGGVLRHTDAAGASVPAPKGAAGRLSRPAAALPADSCAACQWTQGLQGRTLAVCRIASPVFDLLPARHSAAPLWTARVCFLRPSRAPPAAASSC